MKRWPTFILAVFALSLTSCAGYYVNGSKPEKLESITKLYVPTFTNDTLEPRLSVLMTNAVIKQIQAAGAYQIVPESEAEATLKGTITSIDRGQWRSVRSNTLRTKELLGRLRLSYTVTDSSGQRLVSGKIQGTSYVPIEANWQLSERQLFSEAAERMALTVSEEIANGW